MANVAEVQDHSPATTDDGRAVAAPSQLYLGAKALGVGAASADLVAMVCASIAAGVGYNFVTYGWLALNASSFGLCFFVALVFLAANIAKRNYSPSRYLEAGGRADRIAARMSPPWARRPACGCLNAPRVRAISCSSARSKSS